MEPDGGFTVIAHRGFSHVRPENTFEAFDHASQCGFAHMETDCQLSKDAACIILHDEKLGRTNNGTGVAWDLTLPELQALDAGSWFAPEYWQSRIPTLAELLARYHNRIHLHLELKSRQPDLPKVVVRELQESGWLDYVDQQVGFSVPGLTITSFHLEQLEAVKKLAPAVRCAWLVHEMPASVLEAALKVRLDGLCPRANVISREEVAAVKAAGLVVRAWGIKTDQLLKDAAAAGADGATVNWPDRAVQVLQQWRMEQQQQQDEDGQQQKQ